MSNNNETTSEYTDALPEIPLPVGRDVEEEGKKFRFQNTFVLLTYKHHLKKVEYGALMRTLIPSITFLRIAHETGDQTTPYIHSHVVINFGKSFQTENARFFDVNSDMAIKRDDDPVTCETIHPHIRALKGRKAFKDAQFYIAKEDPENKDLLEKEEKPNWVAGVMNSDSPMDAVMKYATKPSDVSGILQIKNLCNGDFRKRTKDRNITLRNWQLDLANELEKNDPSDDKVIWIYDSTGGAGKGTFGKYMRDTYKTDDGKLNYLYTQDLGTSYHASTIIYNALLRGWQQRGIIINLVRSAEDDCRRIYTFMEEIKEGEICVQKYAGQTISFDPPHLVVMANWLPQVAKLSLHRWDIRRVHKMHSDDKEWVIEKMNASDIMDKQARGETVH